MNGVQRLDVLILDQRIQISVRPNPWLSAYWGPPASSDPSASGWGGDLTYPLASEIQNQGCEAARRLTLAEREPDELNTLSLLLCTLATTSLIHATVTLLFWCFPLRRDRKCVTFPAESATLKVSEELEYEAIWQRDDCSSAYCFLHVIIVKKLTLWCICFLLKLAHH